MITTTIFSDSSFLFNDEAETAAFKRDIDAYRDALFHLDPGSFRARTCSEGLDRNQAAARHGANRIGPRLTPDRNGMLIERRPDGLTLEHIAGSTPGPATTSTTPAATWTRSSWRRKTGPRSSSATPAGCTRGWTGPGGAEAAGRRRFVRIERARSAADSARGSERG